MNKLSNSKKIITTLVLILFTGLFTVQSVYANNITSYVYNKVDQNMYTYFPSPSPYNYEASIYASDLGVDSLGNIAGIFVRGDLVYISAGDKIIVADQNFKTQKVITSITYNGEEQALSDVNGLFVTSEGEIYACEPGKSRILHFNSDYTVARVLGRPEGMIIANNVAYQPIKVVVDNVGRIYVIANNIYEGIIELNVDGTFSKYFGVVKVKYTAMELFWRSIQTEEQRAMSTSWLPVDFSNFTIDKDNFIYATVAGSDEYEPIRKLNAKGTSILRYPASTKVMPHGDLWVNAYGRNIPKGTSLINAIDVNDFGVYVALDSKRNRVFAYDDDGYMLFAMGEQGTKAGTFQNPIDIKYMGDKLLVVDKGNMSIEVFSINEYGKGIMDASKYQYESDYKAAAIEWEKVLDMNQNFQYAYVGIGKALYRSGDYKTAQKYFLLGQDADYYSMAFKKTRQEFISNNFGYFIAAVALIIVLRYLLAHFKKVRMGSQLSKG